MANKYLLTYLLVSGLGSLEGGANSLESALTGVSISFEVAVKEIPFDSDADAKLHGCCCWKSIKPHLLHQSSEPHDRVVWEL